MSSILTEQYVRLEPRPAAFGPRLLAALLDAIVIIGYLFMLVWLITSFKLDHWLNEWVIAALFLIPTTFYYPLMETYFDGSSLGKMVLGLRVVSSVGGQPTVSAYFIRWLLLPVDALGGFVCGILCIVFSKNSQRLGDMAAGTMVINERALTTERVSLDEFAFLTTDYRPVFPSANKLTSGQADAIREALMSRASDRFLLLLRLVPKVEAIAGPLPLGWSQERYLLTVWQDYQFTQA